MKIRFPMTLALLILLSGHSAAAQSVGMGFGFGDIEIVTIGAVARHVLWDYLAQEHKRLCPARPNKMPESCKPVKPRYVGENLPRNGAYIPLPPDILKKTGFIQPGTAYLRGGYTIYLVRLPDWRIWDSISLWEEP
jgi:hypothetical protein